MAERKAKKTRPATMKADTLRSPRDLALPGRKQAIPPAKPAAVSAAAGKYRMGAPDKKRYRKMLLSLQDKVTQQISFLADDSLKRVEYDIPMDGGSEDFDRDFALNLLSSEHDAMYEINAALARIEDGSFGRCEKCGNKIDSRRLDAVPFATMCIACQSVSEKDKPLFRPMGDTLLSNNGGKATGNSTAAGSDE